MSEIDDVARSLLRHSAGEWVYDSGSPGDLKSDIMKLANAWLASTTKATPKDNRSRTMAELSREEREWIAEKITGDLCRINLLAITVEQIEATILKHLPGPKGLEWVWNKHAYVWQSPNATSPKSMIHMTAQGAIGLEIWNGEEWIDAGAFASIEEAKQAAQKDWEARA